MSLLHRRKPDAFETLLRPHLDALYRLAYRFTGNPADAEDLVQDVLTKLYPRRAVLASVEQLRPWLARVLYRQFLDNSRRHARTPFASLQQTPEGERLDPEDSLAALPDPAPGPEEMAVRHTGHVRLQHALDALGADHRLVLMLHDVEGYTLNELETMLETPLGTLKSRLHRARRQLRERLEAGREPFGAARRVNP
jgi:RNA polymerase sigma-70 factor (ECF subfamily)